MTSIIRVGGKQFTVKPESTLTVDRVSGAVGDMLTFDDLLGGKPVTGKIVAHTLGDKVETLRFRNKTRYSRKVGHRQTKTVLAFSTTVAHNKNEASA